MEFKNHKITKEQREEYIGRVTQEALNNSKVRSFRFYGEQVRELLGQEGVNEFVAEKGIDEKGGEVLVLHCKDAKMEMLPIILEISIPCPPFCS